MACPWWCACYSPFTPYRSCYKQYKTMLKTWRNNFEWEGPDQQRLETRNVVFSWECLNIFATGCSSILYVFVSFIRVPGKMRRALLWRHVKWNSPFTNLYTGNLYHDEQTHGSTHSGMIQVYWCTPCLIYDYTAADHRIGIHQHLVRNKGNSF